MAAVSLNNVDNLEISNCSILRNRHDVPVVGLFSAARQLRPYGKYLKDTYSNYKVKLWDSTLGRQTWVKASDAYDDLISAINNVYDDVINGNGSIDYEEFTNMFLGKAPARESRFSVQEPARPKRGYSPTKGTSTLGFSQFDELVEVLR